MKISIKNQIELDGQIELIDQLYPVEWKEKGDYHYLLYQNEEAEKVVLKFNDQELVMTRFSEPKSMMRFLKNEAAQVAIHTPLGLQHFLTQTEFYALDLPQQTLNLHYRLTTIDSQQVFAHYKLQISWS
ncbi:DUF1934 domain-containing protein [Streptococcus massiliensis]|uniref:Hypothetical cytosolic protein n=1 Tax=Streptococcus massiliensis TaxID=313439 RepID=A0A380KY20_9STRE|nr:DUF1934 domain-containing protein [Streptococcus massiliensis]SUN76169.1 hypothetical cytosolic protein [Streptococcus massiliensis]